MCYPTFKMGNVKCLTLYDAIHQAAIRQPVTAEGQVHSHSNLCGMFSGQSGTGAGLSPTVYRSTSVTSWGTVTLSLPEVAEQIIWAQHQRHSHHTAGLGWVARRVSLFLARNWNSCVQTSCFIPSGVCSCTVRSESRCALTLRYVDLVVSIEVAVDIASNTSYKCTTNFRTQICRECLRIKFNGFRPV
jgi:hypothetical protein